MSDLLMALLVAMMPIIAIYTVALIAILIGLIFIKIHEVKEKNKEKIKEN